MFRITPFRLRMVRPAIRATLHQKRCLAGAERGLGVGVLFDFFSADAALFY